MTTNTNEKKLLYLIISGVACGAYSIDEGYERVYGQLQKVREEERKRIVTLIKQMCRTTEPEWIAGDLLEELDHSELDQDKKSHQEREVGYSLKVSEAVKQH